MKYSIIGRLHEKEDKVVEILNEYTLWRLYTGITRNLITDAEMTEFEVWISLRENAMELYNSLTEYVKINGDYVGWHRCFHDEGVITPCVAEEEYRK